MALTDDIIYQRLATVFQDVFDDDALTPHAAMSAKDVPEWDSMSHIRLVVAVEEEFAIKLSTAELAKLENVGQMVVLIRAKAA
jgi:acyl carrier protein